MPISFQLFTIAILLYTACGEVGERSAEPFQRSSWPVQKDIERHEEFMRAKDRLIETGGTSLVFIGDSITDYWRSDPQHKIFTDYFGPYRPYNIGVAGDETQHVLWRIEHGELDGITPKVTVLLVGTNNLGNSQMSPEETAGGVTSLVQLLRRMLPDTRIILLGIFPRGNRSDDPFRALISRTNALIATLHDGEHVFYLDIGAQFLSVDGTLTHDVMPDYLHPSPRGYEIWAAAIKSKVGSLERSNKH
jgi:lysophospholipase L1-like esterase